jgi:hypothetical protein
MATSGAFKKGDVRINRGGAPKKSSEAAAAIMRELGFEPIAHMIKLVLETRSEKVKQEGTAWLGDKIYPNLKAIEHSGDKEAPVIMRFNLAQVLQAGEE